MSDHCVLCRWNATFEPRTGDWLKVTCARCGDYKLNGTAEAIFSATPLGNSGSVSGWIRHQNRMGITPNIIDDAVHLRALMKPPFQERVEQYLICVAEKSARLDQPFKPIEDEFIGISYSDDANELLIILDYLRQEGLMTRTLESQGERLTPKGYILADELRTRRAASTQAFVAMWFTDQMEPVYDNGLDPGIRNAGFRPMLIRSKEHANKIDDEIIAEIRRSAFLVADFTGHRQNVYFETGFAIGLGLQVIWTCRKDHISELHFDIRQYNCIDWKDEAELAQRLQRRIEAMFGQGPLRVS
jgi:hypothetical protein